MSRLKVALHALFRPELPEGASRQRRWEARAEGPMLLISVAFLILFAWTTLGTADDKWTNFAEVGMWLTWVAFAVDYLVRLVLAENRWRWFFVHIWELALVILPMFRALRILRVVPILVLLQRYSATQQRVSVAMYTAAGSFLLILVAALSIYDLEHADPDSQINNFGDAIWWSFVTVTTVGYGDIAPVSSSGRILAVFLMFAGIAIFGVVSVTVASWLIEQVESSSQQ
ncbi:MAG TPA: potassium channel family protein [Candidatus Corynebacterium gallistercoris]|uniref:Potassium channel family protein n=1 Tax=Candidatus Corynebacterium gallistercoris TaxID=2838530 RepID=A0A9D1S0M6_9CORY|nr:potassium channel family protein [Candidatus Corynebacterium gallistercoris]